MVSHSLLAEIRDLIAQIRKEQELNRHQHEPKREQSPELAAGHDQRLQLTREFMRRNSPAESS